VRLQAVVDAEVHGGARRSHFPRRGQGPRRMNVIESPRLHLQRAPVPSEGLELERLLGGSDRDGI